MSGLFRRLGSYTCSSPALPRAHNMPRDFGFSGLGLSLRMMPSSTTAITEHLLGHSSQVVGTSRRWPRVTTLRLRSEHDSDDATAPAPAAPDVAFRNLRRSISSSPWKLVWATCRR